MKLPYLARWDKTPLTVTVTQGIDENGQPAELLVYEGMCNFMGTSRTVRASDGQYVTLGGVLTSKGDIAPAYTYLSGFATVNGLDRNIHSSEKVLNPDGTVNHTRLELL